MCRVTKVTADENEKHLWDSSLLIVPQVLFVSLETLNYETKTSDVEWKRFEEVKEEGGLKNGCRTIRTDFR